MAQWRWKILPFLQHSQPYNLLHRTQHHANPTSDQQVFDREIQKVITCAVLFHCFTKSSFFLDLQSACFSAHNIVCLDLRSFWLVLCMLTWTRNCTCVSWQTGIYALSRVPTLISQDKMPRVVQLCSTPPLPRLLKKLTPQSLMEMVWGLLLGNIMGLEHDGGQYLRL